MTDNLKSETSNKDSPIDSSNQQDVSKSKFYPNSAYRSSIKKTQVTRKIPAGIVAKYINAMVAYDALRSDENYNYLEEVKKEYKDFLISNQ
ncbi:MAG: hypothetical protein D4R39_02510 [Methylophilaceae bacterium]|nr:MAG: hypothetical protein D4R39_02510 [Methylophilaceae bacterium]